MHACMYTYMHACMYTYIHTYIHHTLYTDIHTYTEAHTQGSSNTYKGNRNEMQMHAEKYRGIHVTTEKDKEVYRNTEKCK